MKEGLFYLMMLIILILYAQSYSVGKDLTTGRYSVVCTRVDRHLRYIDGSAYFYYIIEWYVPARKIHIYEEYKQGKFPKVGDTYEILINQ